MSKPNLPKWSMYANYSNGNYGIHALRFDVDGNSFWFSYKTLVAFQKGFSGIIVRQNDWGPTTGKHLNVIDGGDKKRRLSAGEFELAFDHAFGHNLNVATAIQEAMHVEG